jgi:hypothetical protein
MILFIYLLTRLSPINPSQFEQFYAAKTEDKNDNRRPCDESTLHPTREDIEDGALLQTEQRGFRIRSQELQTGRTIPVAGGVQNYVASMPSPIEGAIMVGNRERQFSEANEENNVDNNMHSVPEAYLVDDETVIIATKPIPWWRQRRTKVLFGFVLLLVVTVFAVTLKITLSPERTITQLIAITASPTISAVPSLQPTLVPSSSQMPSSSPSACFYRVINSTVQIQLDLMSSNQTNVKAAIDGHNLVVVWQEFFGGLTEVGNFYIAFYLLSDDDKWISSGYLIEENVRFDRGLCNDFDVDISGKTAVIGLPAIDMVYVFKQNNAGLWLQVSSPQPTDQVSSLTAFGVFVYICDGILAVSDTHVTTYCAMPSATYFFEQQGDVWKQIGAEENYDYLVCEFDCSYVLDGLHGPIFAILASNGTQYPRCPKSSVFATKEEEGLMTFQWDHSKNTSTFTGRLNSSHYGDGFGQTFAMGDGLFVVGSSFSTYIFAQENDNHWEEVVTLAESYDSYALSGRTLVAVKDNAVHLMNIADCTPELTTPAQSSLNTTCYEVDISIRFSYKTEDSYLMDIWPELPHSDDAESIVECNEMTVGYMTPWSLIILQSDFIISNSTVVSSTAGNGYDCGRIDTTNCLHPGWYKAIYERVGEVANFPWENICHNITFDFPASIEKGFNLTGCSRHSYFFTELIEFDVPLTTMRWLGPTSTPTTSSSPTNYPSITPYPTKFQPSHYPTYVIANTKSP